MNLDQSAQPAQTIIISSSGPFSPPLASSSPSPRRSHPPVPLIPQAPVSNKRTFSEAFSQFDLQSPGTDIENLINDLFQFIVNNRRESRSSNSKRAVMTGLKGPAVDKVMERLKTLSEIAQKSRQSFSDLNDSIVRRQQTKRHKSPFPHFRGEELAQDLKKMINDPQTSDVVFTFGDQCTEKKIYAHGAILIARSNHFKELLSGDLLPLKNQQEISLTGHRKKAVKSLLRFIYTNSFKAKNKDDLIEIYKLAQEFKLNILPHCLQFLEEDGLPVESVLPFLMELSKSELSETELYQYVFLYVLRHSEKIFYSIPNSKLGEIPSKIIIQLLSSPHFMLLNMNGVRVSVNIMNSSNEYAIYLLIKQWMEETKEPLTNETKEQMRSLIQLGLIKVPEVYFIKRTLCDLIDQKTFEAYDKQEIRIAPSFYRRPLPQAIADLNAEVLVTTCQELDLTMATVKIPLSKNDHPTMCRKAIFQTNIFELCLSYSDNFAVDKKISAALKINNSNEKEVLIKVGFTLVSPLPACLSNYYEQGSTSQR